MTVDIGDLEARMTRLDGRLRHFDNFKVRQLLEIKNDLDEMKTRFRRIEDLLIGIIVEIEK